MSAKIAIVKATIKNLGISTADAESLKFHRVHRIFRKTGKIGPRGIIARFALYEDRERVRRKAYMLKGTGIAISEDYCPETAAAIKRLLPVKRKAITCGHKAYINWEGKLFVNGKLYSGDGSEFDTARNQNDEVRPHNDVAGNRIGTRRGRSTKQTNCIDIKCMRA